MNVRYIALVPLTFLILLIGCQNSGEMQPRDFSKVRIGMTKDEMVQAVGKPQSVSATETYEILRYYEDHGNWVHIYHEFVFVDGHLKIFGIADNPEYQKRFELTVKHR